MPTLYETTCNTSWHGKPEHSIKKHSTGTIAELLAMQDADIARWQAGDIEANQELEAEEAKEEGREPLDLGNEWARIDDNEHRWEMDLDRPTQRLANAKPGDIVPLRAFAYVYEDGGRFSVQYHIEV
jgi:hypothetical protein